MKKVLLIAGLQERYYFDPFVLPCKKRGVSLYVCDPARYPTGATLCAAQDGTGRISGFIDVLRLDVNSLEPVRLLFSEIQVAWYLREGIASRQTSDDLEWRYAANETRQTLRAIFSTLDCTWVNKPESTERVNSNKLLQQTVAARSGLLIPETIVSNDPEKVVPLSKYQAGLLLKSMGYIKLDDEGKLALYSERFSHEELANSCDSIRACPVFGQEYIEKLYEYRVMVIGHRVLSCRIDSQASPATRVDWRHYDFKNVEHKQIDLPEDVQNKLRKCMALLDLRFGAIDLIETPQKEFVFLEVNPSGQWGWIADLAGVPVAEAVADMLKDL